METFREPLDVEDFDEEGSTICEVSPADTFPEPLDEEDPEE